jgi:Xaa-Pro aminopeptidase
MKPLQTDEAAADMRKILEETSFSKEIYRKACEDALEFRGHFQHPVGMSVHDVGRHKGKPLEVGMVFSIDPMIWVHEEKLYIRMEDVVVVTEDGVENLSANLPIEMDDLETTGRYGLARLSRAARAAVSSGPRGGDATIAS